MNDRRAPVKVLLLTLPLLAAVLVLHAWGDALAGNLDHGRHIYLTPAQHEALVKEGLAAFQPEPQPP